MKNTLILTTLLIFSGSLSAHEDYLLKLPSIKSVPVKVAVTFELNEQKILNEFD